MTRFGRVLRTLPLLTVCCLFGAAHRATTWSGTDGSSWTSTRLHVKLLTALAVDPAESTYVYVADDMGHLYRTTTGGRTFQIAGTTLHAAVRAISIDPAHRATVYVLTNQGLYKSVSGGNSYTRVGRGLPSSIHVHAIYVSPSRVLYAGATSGLLRSSDGGLSFTTVRLEMSHHRSQPQDVWGIMADTRHATTLYAISAAGINVSTDNGRVWHLDDSTGPLATIAIAPRALGGTVYLLTTLGRALIFTGNGLQDTLTQIDPPEGVFATSLAAGDCGRLYVGTRERGIYVTEDGGLSWSAADSGPPTTITQLGQTTTVATPAIYALAGDRVVRLLDRWPGAMTTATNVNTTIPRSSVRCSTSR